MTLDCKDCNAVFPLTIAGSIDFVRHRMVIHDAERSDI